MHLQVMFAGRDVATCRRASFIAAVLIPPTGFVCALAGMYMRMAQPGLDASHALPAFLLDYLGPVIGVLGVVSLLLAVVGTGAGLAHSMSIIVAKDIYGRCLLYTSRALPEGLLYPGTGSFGTGVYRVAVAITAWC